MRIRKLMIGAVVTVAGVLAMSSVASAAFSSQTYDSNAAKTKQDKKVRGPVGTFTTNVDTVYSGGALAPSLACPGTGPGCTFFPPANQTVLNFDTAYKFNPGNLPDCNPAALTGQTAAGARAACPDSVVGQGSAVIRAVTGAFLFGTVTAFNGVPSGSSPVILLHTDIQGNTAKPILTGTLNGTTLTVQVPVTPGTVIQHFDTTINQVKVKKANKKKNKPSQFYVSAKCNDGSWDHNETTTFTDGTNSGVKTFSQPCTKKKSKGGK